MTLPDCDPRGRIPKIEFDNYSRPVCPSDHFDVRSGMTVYWNPNQDGVMDLMRSIFSVVNVDDCTDEPGAYPRYLKDYPYNVTEKNYLCLSKRNRVCIEGYCVGGPAMWYSDEPGNRQLLQFGVVVRADSEWNHGLAVRVDANAELIRNLTDCYLVGSGVNTVQSPIYPSHCA